MRHVLLRCALLCTCCVALSACRTDVPRAQRSTPLATMATPPTPQLGSQAAPRSAAAAPTRDAVSDALASKDAAAQPEELGDVRWLRDFEQAQKLSKKTSKPMFVLFTEVPGCSTVKGFADDVLTHPLIVEAIETQFVPVVVYNNVKGKDRQVLESFSEPTWNNPVVRLMNAKREALTPRFSGPYNVASLLPSMLAALDASPHATPTYLRALEQETRAHKKAQRAVFSMYCFWSGEVKLGDMDGVLATRTGFAKGKEVVEVTYDPALTSTKALAKSFGSAPMSQDARVSSSLKDDKYQLQHSTWRHVPMTPQQASRVNAALASKRSPSTYLSARQIALHDQILAHPRATWDDLSREQDIKKAWNAVKKVQRGL